MDRNTHLIINEFNTDGKLVQQYISEYLPDELADMFTVHERRTLAAGKKVVGKKTRGWGHSEYADAIAFFNRSAK